MWEDLSSPTLSCPRCGPRVRASPPARWAIGPLPWSPSLCSPLQISVSLLGHITCLDQDSVSSSVKLTSWTLSQSSGPCVGAFSQLPENGALPEFVHFLLDPPVSLGVSCASGLLALSFFSPFGGSLPLGGTPFSCSAKCTRTNNADLTKM